LQTGRKVPVPQHRCLLPAQLLAARASEQELGPLCSLAPRDRLCSCSSQPRAAPALGQHHAHHPWTPAGSVPGTRDPGVEPAALPGPSPAQTRRALTHRSAGAGPCTSRGAPRESCSPGEPRPPPRPPWGSWGVSPPFCGTEEMGRDGEGEASAKGLCAAGLLGAAGKDVGCARGLLASSVLLPCPVAVLPGTAGWGLQPR